MRLLRSHRSLAALAAASIAAAALTACAAEDKAEDKTGQVADADECATEDLVLRTPGVLTIATDSPAYDPWFSDNDPTNGKGFEAAVAYAIADELGFDKGDVKWIKVGFNSLAKPGDKDFDFDINQVSISAERDKVIDFSEGYYSAAQALIALKGSPAAEATSVEDLKGLKLGAQTGTTSLTAIREVIQPDEDPAVLDDTNVAKQQLQNGQLDAIVADLPTALYISAVEIPDSTIVGQFQVETDQTEQFGLVFQQGSELLPCVNLAIETLKDDGTLADIEEEWLGSDAMNVPVLQ
ncbi:amino acid ABC transporter substrate-binding protein [Nocardioides humilatus]|uniref:Amino acid ABC transporter substrate-binding protein n=1 Tax=Nocardioides humilatus TaxID=2607660 RepID=A0A5B1L4U8_9ACTN|nr:ABC transporter substrate-binding protein [Nocardioides humilatus]KAA1415524.1 amino acid ABC transporter substrate-binding protein [Nocardioides humilatus]